MQACTVSHCGLPFCQATADALRHQGTTLSTQGNLSYKLASDSCYLGSVRLCKAVSASASCSRILAAETLSMHATVQGVGAMERGDWPASAAALSQALAGIPGGSSRAAHYLAAVLLLQARVPAQPVMPAPILAASTMPWQASQALAASVVELAAGTHRGKGPACSL